MSSLFVLILFAHVGLGGRGDSNSLAVAEFTSQERCEVAGRAVKKLATGTVKQIEFVCLPK